MIVPGPPEGHWPRWSWLLQGAFPAVRDAGLQIHPSEHSRSAVHLFSFTLAGVTPSSWPCKPPQTWHDQGPRSQPRHPAQQRSHRQTRGPPLSWGLTEALSSARQTSPPPGKEPWAWGADCGWPGFLTFVICSVSICHFFFQ